MPGPDGRFLKGEHWRPEKPHWDAAWLRNQYSVQGRSAGDIATEAGVTAEAIHHWLRKHGIQRRTTAEARALKHWGVSGAQNPMHGKTGAANPRYVDGSSPERQRLYAQGHGRSFLAAIRDRDGHRCQKCGAARSDARSLHVHHIKPWAGNEALRFDPSNVVSLCRECHEWVHSRANADREFLA
jgi:thymidylate synthase (FAD)